MIKIENQVTSQALHHLLPADCDSLEQKLIQREEVSYLKKKYPPKGSGRMAFTKEDLLCI
jgi:hypothetical protein